MPGLIIEVRLRVIPKQISAHKGHLTSAKSKLNTGQTKDQIKVGFTVNQLGG